MEEYLKVKKLCVQCNTLLKFVITRGTCSNDRSEDFKPCLNAKCVFISSSFKLWLICIEWWSFLLQNVVLLLVNATAGGVVGDQPEATITVETNDNPHGTVEFALEDNVVQETDLQDNIATLRVIRRLVFLLILIFSTCIEVETRLSLSNVTKIRPLWLCFLKTKVQLIQIDY